MTQALSKMLKFLRDLLPDLTTPGPGPLRPVVSRAADGRGKPSGPVATAWA